MRACWIDTSSMFRTFAGLMETAKLVMNPNRQESISFEEAQSWAKRGAVDIVPQAMTSK